MRRSFPRPFSIALVLAGGLLAPGCELQHTSSPAALPAAPPPPTTPPAPVQVYGCGLPRGTGDGFHCGFEDTKFAEQVHIAIQRTLSEHAEWFEGNHVRDGHVGHYVDETVDNLRRMGFCAFNDGEEVAVKNSNDFNEQFDIISGGGNVVERYAATCRPAWSAIPPAGNDS